MSWRTPPLNALRAFEAAARHSSFTRAADELCVTPGAVSRQIRGLEDFLGKPLFERSYREVRLTDASRAYASALSHAFTSIEDATRIFNAPDKKLCLNIFAPITFTLRWLMPHLASYHMLHPQQGIRVSSIGAPPTTLSGIDIDVAVRLAGKAPGLIAHRLFPVELVPVCSPDYRDAHVLDTARDLVDQTLLISVARPNDWPNWFEHAGIVGAEPVNLLQFQSSSLAYQAALSGVGVAIAMRALVQEDLDAGRLVTPFDFAFKDGAFNVVYSADAADDRRITDFSDWIVAEAESLRA